MFCHQPIPVQLLPVRTAMDAPSSPTTRFRPSSSITGHASSSAAHPPWLPPPPLLPVIFLTYKPITVPSFSACSHVPLQPCQPPGLAGLPSGLRPPNASSLFPSSPSMHGPSRARRRLGTAAISSIDQRATDAVLHHLLRCWPTSMHLRSATVAADPPHSHHPHPLQAPSHHPHHAAMLIATMLDCCRCSALHHRPMCCSPCYCLTWPRHPLHLFFLAAFTTSGPADHPHYTIPAQSSPPCYYRATSLLLLPPSTSAHGHHDHHQLVSPTVLYAASSHASHRTSTTPAAPHHPTSSQPPNHHWLQCP